MRPNQRLWSLAATGLALLLANGCGRSQEQPDLASPDEGPVTLEESPRPAATPEHGSSPAEKCIEMATREDWSAALAPCTLAARDHPDDEAIQEALERAIEASEEPIE